MKREISFFYILLPLLFLFLVIAYGLIIGPSLFDTKPFPLEVVFLLAAIFTIFELLLLGFTWETILDAIVAKLVKGFPAILIFFAIGILIGSWIISGTIPMLVYYGIKLIDPQWMYPVAFIVPIIFSTLTGTSWGSIGTIGVVIIGVATIAEVNLGITAGAIVGGAYFGDKLSPLSDTTNIASIATDVDLYDHIRSMLYTTIPSAFIALLVFTGLSFNYTPADSIDSSKVTSETLSIIKELFSFNILLIVPPLIVLYGSLTKKATIPTMLLSAVVACLLGMIVQDYTLYDYIATLWKGYNTNMAIWVTSIPENIMILFNRGGLYSLNEAIVFTIMVFVFIGAMDVINAMPTIVNKIFKGIESRPKLIISSLIAAAFSNIFTSSQYAASFITGDAFKSQYDRLGIPRKVLSRSIEDYGTMIETLVPWTASTLYAVGTLGVAYVDYAPWQLMSLINIIVAPLLAITGKGCFYSIKTKLYEKKEI